MEERAKRYQVMKEKCINFDWVQVWTYEPVWLSCAEAYRAAGWVVKERPYGTRIFNEVMTLFDKQGVPFVEICRNPKSKKSEGGIISDKACSIRLVNQSCYSPTAIKDLISFLEDYGFSYKHDKLCGIQRLDIAMDFTKFDVLEDSPQRFVNDYMAGKYSKVTQPRVRAVGIDGYAFKRYNSLSWGSTSSMVSTKMYCKTQEMAEVKEKPWIRQAWVDAGVLNSSTDETPVWRIEFKLTSECHEWIDEDGVVINNTLEAWSSEQNLMHFVKGLMEHYCDFRIVSEKSKYKADKVDMWRWPLGIGRAKPRRKEHFRDTGRAELILMNKLDRMKDVAMSTTDLTALLAVKQMVLALYRQKKDNYRIDAGAITPAGELQRTIEILRNTKANANNDMDTQYSIENTIAAVEQVSQTLTMAMECETLWKSLFPSSRTGVQLSDFTSEYSAKGWFVSECKRLKIKHKQMCEFAEVDVPLLQAYREIYPEQLQREIYDSKMEELYWRNEVKQGRQPEEPDEVGR